MNNQRRKEIEAVLNELADLRSRIETIQSEEQDAYDNMPEGLQASERGEKADVLPLLLASIESGNSVAHDAAKKELQRMATAADNYNDFVSRRQETNPETPPIPRIEVYQYLGYNGGFARERILLWVCDVIGVSGERRRACAASWHGNPDKVYAIRHAAEKHAFNGWPVFDIGRQEQRDDKPKN